MGNALGYADWAQTRWQSNSRHNACSWLQQFKKKKKITKETKKIWGEKIKKQQARKKREIRFLNTRNLQKKFSPPNFLFSSFFLLTPTLRKCLRFKSNKYQPHKKSVYPKKSLQQSEFHLQCYQQQNGSPCAFSSCSSGKDHFDLNFLFHFF